MSAIRIAHDKPIDLGGYALRVSTQGAGPAVVMEAPIWDIGLTWSLVQPTVAQFAQAITYDRAGYGHSDPSPKPRDGATIVDELHTLLQRAEIPPPYILVGQSYAGMLVQLFAYYYPRQVAGLVLVDSAHEDQDRRFPEAIRAMAQPMMHAQLDGLRQMKATVAAQGTNVVPSMFPIPPQIPPPIAEAYKALTTNTVTRLDTMIGELENLEKTRDQLRAARDDALKNIPIIVLSHGQSFVIPNLPDEVNREYEATWQTLQQELTAQSARGKRIVVENAGHMIHLERPDLVVAAIREVIDASQK
jgi:pimeloyl-ACP methyl ester carboxylesterase